MKYALLCVTGIFLAVASVAVAQTAPWAVTGSKAEAMVKRDATVQLPQQERAELESELRAAVAQYSALEQTAALQDEFGHLAGVIHNLRYRSSTALKQVQRGIDISAVACAGTGRTRGINLNLFSRFRCSATSRELMIPVASIVWEGDQITGVIESEPRIEGPYRAQLDIRVTGRSRLSFRQLGVE